MSIEIKDQVATGDFCRIAVLDEGAMLVDVMEVRRTPLPARANVSRADFLAAVEAECGVRIVPGDSIVIDRAELPEVFEAGESMHTGDGDWRSGTAAGHRHEAMRNLAMAEYRYAHPSVDEAQVRAVNDVLASYVARWRRNDLDLARQLVAWGVRVDLP